MLPISRKVPDFEEVGAFSLKSAIGKIKKCENDQKVKSTTDILKNE